MLKILHWDQKCFTYSLVLVLLTLALYIFNIGGYDLGAPDEPRYGEVAREMQVDANYAIPHLNNGIYHEKPPLFFGVTALFTALVGKATVTTVRLPVIILACLLLGLLTYYFGTRLGKKVGVIAGLILATTCNFFWMAMRVNLDIPLIFCTTLALILLYEELAGTKPSYKSYLAFFLMGVGTLFKSQAALIPIAVIIVYALLSKKGKQLKNIPWFRGFLLYLAVVAVWVVSSYIIGGYSYFKVTILDQIVTYSTGAKGHPGPFYYYLTSFPFEALPWTIFIIPAFYYLYQKRNELPDLVKFALIWFITIFIIFSIIGSKRGIYLLQLYPAFALLIAWFFGKHLEKPTESFRGLRIPVICFGLLLFFAGLLISLKGITLIHKGIDFTLVSKTGFILALKYSAWFLMVIAILFITSAFTKRKIFIFAVTIGFSIGALLLVKGIILPTMNPIKSERYLAEDLAKLRDKGQSVGLWGSVNNDSGIIFYNGIYFDKVLTSNQEVKAFLNQPNEVLMVSDDADKFFNTFTGEIPKDWQIKRYQLGLSRMLLIKNK
ncbi:MAG TPA: glycosyl transferase family 39 [Firmicutes bacterium]|nr:glycosyl transferase family 39 [Bacillota bacterium]